MAQPPVDHVLVTTTQSKAAAAARAGARLADWTQRLLSRAVWDTFAAMGEVRRFAVAGLEEAGRRLGRRRGLVLGALDETSQVKAGTATAGVKRHYLGCAGKVANGIITVHLSYVRERTGHALAGARQWIPREHVDEPVRSAAMGLPADLVFRTKGQLAVDICAAVLDDGIRFGFLCGDSSWARTASAWTTPRSASTPRSPATPSWSWPPWPSAPSPPPCSAAAPTLRARHPHGRASRPRPTRA
jgi:hypothetical protein